MSPEYHGTQENVITRQPEGSHGSPLRVGDAIHVLNRTVYQAVVSQDEDALATMARRQAAAGAQALAVNLGPGRMMGEKASWVVKTLVRHTSLPLFFSANILDRQDVLREHGHRLAINAVTADRGELDRALAVAGEHGASLVVLLVRSGSTVSGVNDRIRLGSEVMEMAVQRGFPLSRLYLDPVLACRPDPAAWLVSRGMPDIGAVIDTISLIRQHGCGMKSILALGSATEGMDRERRSGMQGRMLSLLSGAGLDAVLLNCLDRNMMRVAEEIQACCPTSPGGVVQAGVMEGIG